VVLAMLSCVLDVMAQLMALARFNPGVDDVEPVHAERLETPEPVKTGARVGVESNLWLRDNDLYAHERSETQFLTPCRALVLRLIPWLSSEAWSSRTPLPSLSLKEGVQSKSRLAFSHGVDRPCQCVSQDGQGFPLAVCFLSSGEKCLRGGMVPQE
jgi:hypothetical protein